MGNIRRMEGNEDRHAEMAAQAIEIVTEVRDRQRKAHQATQYITALFAYGLREQGFSDSAIGEALSISRNRVSDLVQQALYPDLDAIGDDIAFVQAQIATTYLPIAQPASGWVHTRTDRSGEIAIANEIALPEHWQNNPAALDTQAAEFDHQDTGDRILVYSLESQQGNPLFDKKKHCVGYDFMGTYRIDHCPADGDRQPMSLAQIGIAETDLRFGSRWSKPAERRYSDDAFGNALRAIRRHHSIWPLPALTG